MSEFETNIGPNPIKPKYGEFHICSTICPLLNIPGYTIDQNAGSCDEAGIKMCNHVLSSKMFSGEPKNVIYTDGRISYRKSSSKKDKSR